MLVGIDGNEANVAERVGVNEYAFQILWGIYRNRGKWRQKHKFLIYLSSPPRKEMPPSEPTFKYKVLPGGRMWILTRLMLNLFIGREKPDVFFSPNHYVPPLAPMPRVVSIMDLGYLEFTGQFKKLDYWQLRLWSAWSIYVSNYIIAISKSTKRSIVKQYNTTESKIVVTYLAVDGQVEGKMPSKQASKKIVKKYANNSEYALFLGTLKPSKNIEGILVAFSKIIPEFSAVKLLIVGKRGWMYDNIFRKVVELELGEKVVMTGFVSEKEKYALIEGARVFLLPSFWEGFGIDALNAMKIGVPVVVSDRGSLPEVVGNAGIVVDPENIDDIAAGMRKVLKAGNKDYNNMVKKGKKQAARFSWDKTALQTIKVLEKAANYAS